METEEVFPDEVVEEDFLSKVKDEAAQTISTSTDVFGDITKVVRNVDWPPFEAIG